jgi:hypothetical protein
MTPNLERLISNLSKTIIVLTLMVLILLGTICYLAFSGRSNPENQTIVSSGVPFEPIAQTVSTNSGNKIFKQNCAACHRINDDKFATGNFSYDYLPGLR